MAKGISLHVGVNATQAQAISAPALKGCANDAQEMRNIAQARGFTTQLLLGDQATFDKVLGEIRLAAEDLHDGDIFLFTFAGHGTRRGQSGTEEADAKDDTIVLHDKMVVDNVLRKHLWPKFRSGVRIVMIADSCYSGTVAMSEIVDPEEDNGVSTSSIVTTDEDDGGEFYTGNPQDQLGSNGSIRSIPEEMARGHFEILADFYAELQAGPPGEEEPIEASLLLLAACEESETTREKTVNGKTHGIYTRALLDVWNTNGSKTYQQLWQGISSKLVPGTNPTMRGLEEELPPFALTEAFKI